MRVAKFFAKAVGIFSLGSFGVAYYNFSEIRNDPYQLWDATRRVVRCAYNGSIILHDYYVG